MIDEELRALERRWRETGSPGDLLRLTRAQTRAGERAGDCLGPDRAECSCVPCRRLRGREPAVVLFCAAGREEGTGRWVVAVAVREEPGGELRTILVPGSHASVRGRSLREVSEAALLREGADPDTIPEAAWRPGGPGTSLTTPGRLAVNRGGRRGRGWIPSRWTWGPYPGRISDEGAGIDWGAWVEEVTRGIREGDPRTVTLDSISESARDSAEDDPSSGDRPPGPS